MPGWILGVIALTSTLLLASSITAGMKIPIWGLLSMLAGVALFALAALGEFAVLRTAGLRPTLGDALSQALENRSPILFVGVPTILILAGITGLTRFRRGGARP